MNRRLQKGFLGALWGNSCRFCFSVSPCFFWGLLFVGLVVGCTVKFGSNGSHDGGADAGDPFCGNGVLEAGEVCDGTDFGGQTCESAVGHLQGELRCNEDCKLDLSDCSTCGDGRIDGSEECDDDNNEDGDGCSSLCREEPGWVCTGEPSQCNFTCGNGKLDEGEVCDDGNLNNGDGCSASCKIEEGWDCSGVPSYCVEICGDGIVAGGEECDDGNSVSGDGCSQYCEVEHGWTCEGDPSVCATECGDGVFAPDEECDDGNTENDDGCSLTCEIEEGWECEGEPSVCQPICGDGVIYGGEECDDGNTLNSDGCSSNCQIEEYTACHGEPSECVCAVYVNVADVSGNRDGSTWNNAYDNVQDAIDVARVLEPCDVWVAEGTYFVYSYSSYNRIDLQDDVGVYGGFAGVETARDERDWQTRVTILDGRSEEGSSQRVRNVVRAENVYGVTLDGFTVTQGAGDENNYGGGLNASGSTIHVENCIFINNWTYGRGGGVMCEYVEGKFENTMFLENTSMSGSSPDEGDGGGILIYDGAVELNRCVVAGNYAQDDGGGVDIWRGDHIIMNSLIYQNTAEDAGGGVRVQHNAYVTIFNTVIYSNSADRGGGLAVVGGDLLLTNSVLWGNTEEQIYDGIMGLVSVRYSVVEGGYTGVGNINDEPMFVDAEGGDFCLLPGSPCIDAADGDLAPEFDFDGNPRVDDPVTPDTGEGLITYVDIGAYEYQP